MESIRVFFCSSFVLFLSPTWGSFPLCLIFFMSDRLKPPPSLIYYLDELKEDFNPTFRILQR